MLKLIFVTGSLSGVGKGTIAASIATMLQAYGHDVTIVKIDPYINVDAGLFNPVEHGEPYVLDEVWEFSPVEGYVFRICEVDQDFGTYERFLNRNLHPSHNITSGQVYLSVILKERKGMYLGRTVRLIPHVTDEIKDRILSIAENHDITIVEVGGTVGDYEAAIFLEAIRQLRNEFPRDDTMLVHVVWVPFLSTVGELKTKPAQHSFRLLLESGLMCDAVIARTERRDLPSETRAKLALYSNIPEKAVFVVPDLDISYETLLVLIDQGLDRYISQRLNIPMSNPDKLLGAWRDFIGRLKNSFREVSIALVGKYTKMRDTYISIIEATKHAAAELRVRPRISIVDSETLNIEELRSYDAIILTPGFGRRGTEGMINTAIYSLRTGIPFLGICFGAQLATVAFAREIMGWRDANSTEIDPSTSHPVVDLMPEQKNISGLGGTMRLGGLDIEILEGTQLRRIYGSSRVRERFRHRYHIMWRYVEKMEDKGFRVSAVDKMNRIAAFELDGYEFFIGVQYHPEYRSRPLSPHPIFIELLRKAMSSKNSPS